MRSLRIAAPVAVGIATLVGVAVAPALASSSSSAQPAPAVVSHEDPTADTAGDPPPLPYPAIVNVSLVRTEAALQSATAAVDGGQPAEANTAMLAARDNMVRAWTAAKYILSQPAPPVDPEDPPDPDDATSAYAAPADTAAGVLNLQHEVVTTSLGLMATADAELAATLRGTISGTVSARDAAINYIHTIAPPPADEGRVKADKSDVAPVGGTFDIVMPLFVPQLDDEILQANGTAMSPASPANFGGWLATKATATESLINTFWPPVVDD